MRPQSWHGATVHNTDCSSDLVVALREVPVDLRPLNNGAQIPKFVRQHGCCNAHTLTLAWTPKDCNIMTANL